MIDNNAKFDTNVPIGSLLDYLDQFIESSSFRSETNTPTDVSKEVCFGKEFDDTLRFADFLFGTTLDGALSIIESDPQKHILNIVSLQSGRCMYIVNGKSKKSANEANTFGSVDPTYTCLMPPARGNAIHLNQAHSVYFCSCRSFVERCRSATGSAVCKHLLALKLMPTFGINCTKIELSTDDDFCKVALQRMSVD